MDIWQQFHGPNAGYILEQYEQFLEDPTSVSEQLQAYFQYWQAQYEPANGQIMEQTAVPASLPTTDIVVKNFTRTTAPIVNQSSTDAVTGAVNLAQALREYGHLAATLDPLGFPRKTPAPASLQLETYGLTKEDVEKLPGYIIGGPIQAENAWQAIQELQNIYCGNIGYDYDHLSDPDEVQWLREAAEGGRFRSPKMPIDSIGLLKRLTEVEAFEQFLHRVFPGKKRFSIEGLDIMVPILDEIVTASATNDINNILIGMAHRGRLNVMTHILGQPYEIILTQFKDPHQVDYYANRNSRGWTGDVKYHMGASRSVAGAETINLEIKIAPNPSHLEHVNPVVEGMARAAGTFVDKPGHPKFNHVVTIPVVIHGDAAFSGQGVVAETLNMYRLRGYRVGGTIHIIANNQIGFTTFNWAARSTIYASDLAKGFKIPVVHVNADDPEACIEAARLAFAYRQKFQKDFLIDLVGYRRYGHNEGDEPAYTQPMMYHTVDRHPTVRQLWANTLINRQTVQQAEVDQAWDAQMDKLQTIYTSLEAETLADELEPQAPKPPQGVAKTVKTAVPADTLRQLNQSLLTPPDWFKMHSKLKRVMKRRTTALDDIDEKLIDWGTAETLAYATILQEGTAIRLTGEDVERGTFSHRHVLWRDSKTGKAHVPLQEIPEVTASFEVRNSPLSENAAIAFEFGYNIQAPERLTIWEAQFGDFVNGAQAMLDEYLFSGNAKWELKPSLVLLLPHGYEGQGPDHSSARPERFLQLAAKTNCRIVNPTTSTQIFHLLRRQAKLLKIDPLPLVVMSPKSLLRHPLAASSLRDLSEGAWQAVIDDPMLDAEQKTAVRRVVLCSGKVYTDLYTVQQRDPQNQQVALVRVEQLYVFPEKELQAVIDGYPNVEEIVWVQEEPANMGAWSYIRPRLARLFGKEVRYIGRPRRASPAEGSHTWHIRNQNAIVEFAFQFENE